MGIPDRSEYLPQWPGREAAVREAFESGDGCDRGHHWPATLSSPTEAYDVPVGQDHEPADAPARPGPPP
ncbi:MAG: hypothetical protein U0835_18460 [Isosphaeraceae bacterium]